MIYAVTVDFFDINAASVEQAKAVMTEMLEAAGFTQCEIRDVREG
jgi:hypothetical protein